jgi:hypothetical protein
MDRNSAPKLSYTQSATIFILKASPARDETTLIYAICNPIPISQSGSSSYRRSGQFGRCFRPGDRRAPKRAPSWASWSGSFRKRRSNGRISARPFEFPECDVAFRGVNNVGTRVYNAFAAQWLAYTLPYRCFAVIVAEDCARIGGDVGCYSFIAVDSHHIPLAGLPAHSLTLRPAHSRGHQFVTRYPKASAISSPP